jgi:hypothetical protein
VPEASSFLMELITVRNHRALGRTCLTS